MLPWLPIRLTNYKRASCSRTWPVLLKFRALSIWSKISEHSSSGLNEKCFFSLPDWKIPRKSGTAQKVVPFSRLERPDWFLVFQLHLPGNLYQFQAHSNFHRPFANQMATEMMYQCWCCFLTTHSMEHLLKHDCSYYENGR